MKKPRISLSKESIADFFLNHGEKFVVGLFAALACTLVWGGIDAVRTKPAKRDQLPAVISEHAGRTMKHIGESKGPPPETTKRQSLARQVEPWKEKMATVRTDAKPFNAPVSDEKAKRVAPEILPLADLHVLPGWAVIAVPQEAMAGMMAANQESSKDGDKDGKKKGKKGDSTGDVAATPPGGQKGGKNKFAAAGAMGMAGPMGDIGSKMTGPMPAAPINPGKIVPYCIVTALVPALAQQDAYMRAFAGSEIQTQADIPVWSDYRIERAEVDAATPADADLKWTRIDLQKIAKQAAEDWTGTQPEIIPADLQVDPSQLMPMDETSAVVMPYLLPLPTLAGDPWGVESLHPWVVAQLRKRQAEMERLESLQREETEQSQRTNILGGGAGGPAMGGAAMSGGGRMMPPMGGAGGSRGMMPPMGGPSGGSRGMMPPMGGPAGGSRGMMPPMGGPAGGSRGMMPPMGGPAGGGLQSADGRGSDAASMQMSMAAMGGPGGMMGGMGEVVDLPAYRMFRFVDTTVEPGKTYRYRIRISLRNPNYGLPAQYLATADLAEKPILPANWSAPSPVAHVPDKNGLLVRALKKGEAKKSKTGFEVLVLAENPENGNYALRSITTELGALANFDKKQAKGPDAKNAESVTTNSLLIDARGRQEDVEAKKGTTATPSEPLELLFLREDGSFALATAAESQRDVERYLQTLPSPDDGKKDKEAEGGSKLFGGGGGAGLFGAPPGGPPGGAGTPRGSMPPGGPSGPGGGTPRGSTPPGGLRGGGLPDGSGR